MQLENRDLVCRRSRGKLRVPAHYSHSFQCGSNGQPRIREVGDDLAPRGRRKKEREKKKDEEICILAEQINRQERNVCRAVDAANPLVRSTSRRFFLLYIAHRCSPSSFGINEEFQIGLSFSFFSTAASAARKRSILNSEESGTLG